ncbi:MFS transporter [Sphingobacterium griseoflavum]|uniref:Transporter n=1 Tax=Sphingobacterium griseoflavum TaxID=1474952 RepID=A0ABQ3HZC2_9SPHI|nr:MFS transporter [Sphingobacterium griseoflavum]GHE35191.1 transporter [Sphingobacterium griseoflavum]
MITTKSTQKVSFAEKVGYSLGDGAANLVFQMMMMFQLFFYTDVFGIKATAAGMILLVVRLSDAFIDPLAGILADRTQTKWGKYRPWILWTSLPFSVFFVLSFTTPDINEKAKIWYAGISYTILMAMYSFNNTPYASLGGVMSSDIRERTSISSIRFVTATIATFVVQGLTLPLVSKFGQGNAEKGWFWTITLYATVGLVLLMIAFLSARERIAPPPGQKPSVKQDFKDIVSCLPWRSMFVLTLFLFVTLAMWGSAMSYYFNYYVDKGALFDLLSKIGLTSSLNTTEGSWQKLLDAFGLIVYREEQVFAVGFSLFNMIGQLVTLVAVVALSQFLAGLFGKKKVFIICLALTALFTALFFFIPAHRIDWIFTVNILKSLAYAPTIPLLWAMMGDVADYSEWKNGRRATGFVFAGIVFALKAGLGIGGALCGGLIDAFGFLPNVPQSETSLYGIRLVASLVPATTFLVGVLALLFYPISKKFNEDIQVELMLRRSSETTAKTRLNEN